MQRNCENERAPADGFCASGLARPWFDRLGIGISLTCAVHCVALAVLGLAPAFAASATSALAERFEWAETSFLWAGMVIGALALVPSYFYEHRRPLPLVIFAAGMGMLALSHWLDGGRAEVVGTPAGVAVVTAAHVLNLRFRQAAHAHG